MRNTIIIATLLLTLLLSGCESGSDYPDAGIQLYQQYEVFIQDNSKAGFANFREGGENGPRLHLTGDAKVSVNGHRMLYTPSTSDDYPEFNYASFIDLTDKKAKFEFKRSKGNTLTNEIDISNIASVTAEEGLRKITTGTPVRFNVNGTLGNNDIIRVILIPTVISDNTVTYEANVNYMTETFTLSDVPAGQYNIRLDVVRTSPTKDNDGNAGGIIRVIRRKTVVEVTVE